MPEGSSKKIIFGTFSSRDELEKTISRLRLSGFLPSEVSVLVNVKQADSARLDGELSWLSGAGAVILPDGNYFLATGPLMEAVAGVDLHMMHDCVAEGITHLGVSEELAKQYQNFVMQGQILLLIHLNQYNWDKSVEYLPGE